MAPAPVTIIHRLPFVSVVLDVQGKRLEVTQVLVDTGSEGTAFHTDLLHDAGITYTVTDNLVAYTGIGGSEILLQQAVDAVEVGELRLSPFRIELTQLKNRFGINGILGFEFLSRTGAVLDLKRLELRRG